MDDEDYHIVMSDDVQPWTDETPQYPQYGHNLYPNEKYGVRAGYIFATKMTGEKTPVSTLIHTGPDPDAPIETRYFGPEECP